MGKVTSDSSALPPGIDTILLTAFGLPDDGGIQRSVDQIATGLKDRILVVAPSARAERELVRRMRRAVRGVADYMVALGARPGPDFLPLRNQGPIMTWREVADRSSAMPPLADWALTLGDIELF